MPKTLKTVQQVRHLYRCTAKPAEQIFKCWSDWFLAWSCWRSKSQQNVLERISQPILLADMTSTEKHRMKLQLDSTASSQSKSFQHTMPPCKLHTKQVYCQRFRCQEQSDVQREDHPRNGSLEAPNCPKQLLPSGWSRWRYSKQSNGYNFTCCGASPMKVALTFNSCM